MCTKTSYFSLVWSFWQVRYQDIIDIRIIIKTTECHIEYDLIQHDTNIYSRDWWVLDNKSTYIDIQECYTYLSYNQYI